MVFSILFSKFCFMSKIVVVLLDLSSFLMFHSVFSLILFLMVLVLFSSICPIAGFIFSVVGSCPCICFGFRVVHLSRPKKWVSPEFHGLIKGFSRFWRT